MSHEKDEKPIFTIFIPNLLYHWCHFYHVNDWIQVTLHSLGQKSMLTNPIADNDTWKSDFWDRRERDPKILLWHRWECNTLSDFKLSTLQSVGFASIKVFTLWYFWHEESLKTGFIQTIHFWSKDRILFIDNIHLKKIRIKFFIQKNWYVQKRDFCPMTKFGFFVFSWIEKLKQVKYMDIQLQWMSHKLWRHTLWRHLPWRHTWCRHPLWIWS